MSKPSDLFSQQKVKPIWILMKQEMMGWQWHQLDHYANHFNCTSLLTDNHASTSSLSFYRPHALSDDQPTAWKHWISQVPVFTWNSGTHFTAERPVLFGIRDERELLFNPIPSHSQWFIPLPVLTPRFRLVFIPIPFPLVIPIPSPLLFR